MRIARVLFIIFLFITSFPLSAIGKDVSEEMLLFFEEKELLIETPARHKQKAKESPSSISVITEDNIKKLPARNLAEILETVVGYDVTYNGNVRRSNIAARGLLDTSLTKRVLFLVDGRPANRVGDGIFDIGFETPVNNIERIEIIRGPGSALYGANAFSGVVNIITKPPKEKGSGDIAATYGTGEAKGYDINFNRPIGNIGLYLTASGLHFDNEGIWNENEQVNRESIGLKAVYKDLTLSFGYNDNDKGLPQKGRYAYKDFVSENLAWFLYGDYKFEPAKNLNLDFNLYLNTSDNKLLYSDKVQSAVNQDQLRDERRIGGEVLANYEISDKFTILSGIAARHERFEYNLDLGADERHSTSKAIFLQIEGKIEKGIVTIGTRYDVHSIYGGHTSPRLSFLYNPMDDARLRFAYGNAYRPPEFLEMYGYRGSTRIGNEDLTPEKVNSYEAGIGYTFSKYMDADITMFYNDIEDIIVFNSGTSKYQNSSGTGSTRGIEVELKSRPVKSIHLFANYTFQETHNDYTEDRFAYAPKHKFNLGLTGEYGSSVLTLTAGYKGSRKDTFGNDLEDYMVINGKYIYRIKKNIDLSIIARNIFDKRYVVEGHDPQYTTGINARDYIYEGVSVWLGLRYQF